MGRINQKQTKTSVDIHEAKYDVGEEMELEIFRQAYLGNVPTLRQSTIAKRAASPRGSASNRSNWRAA